MVDPNDQELFDELGADFLTSREQDELGADFFTSREQEMRDEIADHFISMVMVPSEGRTITRAQTTPSSLISADPYAESPSLEMQRADEMRSLHTSRHSMLMAHNDLFEVSETSPDYVSWPTWSYRSRGFRGVTSNCRVSKKLPIRRSLSPQPTFDQPSNDLHPPAPKSSGDVATRPRGRPRKPEKLAPIEEAPMECMKKPKTTRKKSENFWFPKEEMSLRYNKRPRLPSPPLPRPPLPRPHELPAQFNLQADFTMMNSEVVEPISFNFGKDGIFAEYGRNGEELFWCAANAIAELLIGIELPSFVGVAVRLKGPEEAYTMISVSWTAKITTVLSLRNFVYRSGLVRKCVSKKEFLSTTLLNGSDEQYVLYELLDNNSENNLVAELENEEETEPSEPKDETVPSVPTQLDLRFPDGYEAKLSVSSVLTNIMQPDGWLSTNIVDVVLEHLKRELQLKHGDNSKGIFIFDSMFMKRMERFYTMLTRVSKQNYKLALDVIYPVKNGRRSIPDISEAKLIVVPVIKDKHWYAVILHRPNGAIYNPSAPQDIRPACRMILLDSMINVKSGRWICRMSLNHRFAFNLLEGWLRLLVLNMGFWSAKSGCRRFAPRAIPTQRNHNDCGVYMLRFIETLVVNDWSWMNLSDDEISSALPFGDHFAFSCSIIGHREQLRLLIKKLATNWPRDVLDSPEEKAAEKTRLENERDPEFRSKVNAEPSLSVMLAEREMLEAVEKARREGWELSWKERLESLPLSFEDKTLWILKEVEKMKQLMKMEKDEEKEERGDEGATDCKEHDEDEVEEEGEELECGDESAMEYEECEEDEAEEGDSDEEQEDEAEEEEGESNEEQEDEGTAGDEEYDEESEEEHMAI